MSLLLYAHETDEQIGRETCNTSRDEVLDVDAKIIMDRQK